MYYQDNESKSKKDTRTRTHECLYIMARSVCRFLCIFFVYLFVCVCAVEIEKYIIIIIICRTKGQWPTTKTGGLVHHLVGNNHRTSSATHSYTCIYLLYCTVADNIFRPFETIYCANTAV